MPRKQVSVIKTSVLTMEDIRKMDSDKRAEIVKEHVKHENMGSIRMGPDGKYMGSDAYNVNRLVHEQVCKRHPESVRYEINQLLRIRTGEGKEYLKVQAIVSAKNSQGVKQAFGADYGIYQVPKFSPAVVGYNTETGEPLDSGFQIDEIEDQFTIPFTPEQVLALQKHFATTVSLLVKEQSGKKWTCSSVEQFIGDYSGTVNQLKDFERIVDERVQKVLRGQK